MTARVFHWRDGVRKVGHQMCDGTADERKGAERRHSRQEIEDDKILPCPLDKVNRQFRVPAPDKFWVSDISEAAFVIKTFACGAGPFSWILGALLHKSHVGFMS